jgi:hypothetical protein
MNQPYSETDFQILQMVRAPCKKPVYLINRKGLPPERYRVPTANRFLFSFGSPSYSESA